MQLTRWVRRYRLAGQAQVLTFREKVMVMKHVKTKEVEYPTCGGARAPQVEEDHWVRDGESMKRVHVRSRNSLFIARVDDPTT